MKLMILNGHADFGITENSDLLVYGCKKVSKKQPGELYSLTQPSKSYIIIKEQLTR
jgi:hypothetical protein